MRLQADQSQPVRVAGVGIARYKLISQIGESREDVPLESRLQPVFSPCDRLKPGLQH